MINLLNKNTSQRLDAILLTLSILFFITSSAVTVYFINQKSNDIAEIRMTNIHEDQFSSRQFIIDQIDEIKNSTKQVTLVFSAVTGLLLLLSIVVGYRIVSTRHKESLKAIEENVQTENDLIEILDIMQQLADGDLTVKANVTSTMTGSLADSLNISIESLHTLVKAVNESSDSLSSSVQNTTEFVDQYTAASQSQTQQINSTVDTVTHVIELMQNVSNQTTDAVKIAENSKSAAHLGSERVQSTISGMDEIREHIQDTSKRIKRLGESSQEIGAVVELISDIADQTQILALNAAIQASLAGEAGKGFAVVADEVQNLAERTANATSRVEDLVKTIQSDTNEAISAMESSTSEVVNGASLAEKAGDSILEIEAISNQLLTLIQGISTASLEVADLGVNAKDNMESIKAITDNNLINTSTTKNSMGYILKLAQELKESVAGFKIN